MLIKQPSLETLPIILIDGPEDFSRKDVELLNSYRPSNPMLIKQPSLETLPIILIDGPEDFSSKDVELLNSYRPSKLSSSLKF